ncbi:MAG: protoheme IX farnesyltransferase [Verrucomicrobia bacterium]|nr:protoheme IX farnesyltransferase [Verrucomicrobiota bacterium]
MKTAVITARAQATSRWSDISQLVKARLTFLVLVTTAVGYYLPDTPFDPAGFFHVLFGAALAAGGAAALNQWWERDFDALMVRTRERPVAAGRMPARSALFLGCTLAAAGIIYLAVTTNLLAAFLAALTVVIYVLAYTPLKRVTTTNTLIGAVPGALPPLIGWAAAAGSLDFAAWTLFAILFIWQMPHFFAIAWMYRHEYQSAGFRMLSRDDESGGRSASQAVLFCIGLLIVGGFPAFIGMAHPLYLVAELLLSGAFTTLAMRFHRDGTLRNARLLFLGSIVYLPSLLAALTIAKT